MSQAVEGIEESQASLQTAPKSRALWIAVSVFALLSLLAAAFSHGFLESDATSHYLAARFALVQPERFVSVWDRPLFVLLYCLPANLGGVMGARVMSLLIALLCAWVTWSLARQLKLGQPALAVGCLLVQPLFFLHSFAEMTELVFAAALGGAMLAYLRRRWMALALLAAILPLGRPEGFGFLLIAAASLLLHRRWLALALLPAGLLAWSLAGWLLFGRPDYDGWGAWSFLRWLPRHWPYSPESVYASGPLLGLKTTADGRTLASFLLRLPVIVSPLLMPLVFWGAWRWMGGPLASLRDPIASLRDRLSPLREPQAQARLLCAGLPLGILAGHSLLWWRGLMASSGELRYLLIAAPFWALLAAEGLLWLTAQLRSGWQLRAGWGVIAAAGAVPILWNFCYVVVPLGEYDDDVLGREVVAWYQGEPRLAQRYPRLCAAAATLYYHLDCAPGETARTARWGRPTIEARPAGTLLIWDPISGMHNADRQMVATREEILAAGWRPLRTFSRNTQVWEVFASD
jgi:hypothetical protein